MITYKEHQNKITVYLDKKKTGEIRPIINLGFAYYPKNKLNRTYHGEIFKSVDLVKKSLEEN